MGGKRSVCKDCGRTRYETGHVSARGLCIPCAQIRHVEGVERSKAKIGPGYERYIARLAFFVDAERVRLAEEKAQREAEEGAEV